MTRRDDTKAETRRLILKAARKLFRRKGVEDCTMRAVAKEAGVSPGTVMLHFKSKTALLEASISEDIGRALAEALEAMPAHAPLLDRLMHIPEAMYRFYDTDRPLYRALVRSTVFEPEGENPLVTKQLNEYMHFVAGMIEAGNEAGEVLPDVDPLVAASSIGSLYMGVLIIFFRNPAMTPAQATAMLRLMKEQYMNAILIERRL